jgi:hypothetical protein
MDFRKRRDDETYRAATMIVAVTVSFMTLVMVSLAIELLALSKSDTWVVGRFIVLRMGVPGNGVSGYLLTIVFYVITFGAGLVSKRLDRVLEWRWIVYASIIGIAASIIALINIAGDAAQYIADDLTRDGMIFDFLPNAEKNRERQAVEERIKSVSISTAIWFVSQLSIQFGVRLPKPTNIDGEKSPP